MWYLMTASSWVLGTLLALLSINKMFRPPLRRFVLPLASHCVCVGVLHGVVDQLYSTCSVPYHILSIRHLHPEHWNICMTQWAQCSPWTRRPLAQRCVCRCFMHGLAGCLWTCLHIEQMGNLYSLFIPWWDSDCSCSTTPSPPPPLII